jgi:hypothetical protein
MQLNQNPKSDDGTLTMFYRRDLAHTEWTTSNSSPGSGTAGVPSTAANGDNITFEVVRTTTTVPKS